MANIIKQTLVNLYNHIYDIKLDFELYLRWKKDLRIQKEYGLPKIQTIDDTLEKIIQDRVSICRYGDGEFKIMDGDKIFFQNGNEQLSNRLKEVIKSNNDKILICIPSFLDRRHKNNISIRNLSKEECKRKRAATKYMDNIVAERRLLWYSYFDMQRIYGNSLVSRFYAGVYDDEKSKRWIHKWKQVWNGKSLLIIEGEKTRLGVGNDLFSEAKRIRRILAPAISAFSVYDSILSATKKAYQENELVLIALGPTATVLAYDLALEGIQALDIGHIDIEYEWYLRKDRAHQKIEGKFVSEAKGGAVVDNIMDSEYLSQIIAVIS